MVAKMEYGKKILKDAINKINSMYTYDYIKLFDKSKRRKSIDIIEFDADLEFETKINMLDSGYIELEKSLMIYEKADYLPADNYNFLGVELDPYYFCFDILLKAA